MKKRILVVDDLPAVSLFIKETLEATNLYEVRTENQGSKAIDEARKFRPDLILLDVLMPDMIGSEVIAQLQADPELRTTRFIFVSGIVSNSEVQRSAGQIGGHKFIAKPLSAKELCRVVAEHFLQEPASPTTD
jgi:CheY-like chemotaxis protein